MTMTHKKIGPSSTHRAATNKKQKRRCGMNRIQRIQDFIEDYHEKTPYLKELCRPLLEYYKQKLIRELVIISNHPYPNEYHG